MIILIMITLILVPGGGSSRNRENSCSSADCCGVGGKLIGKEEEGEEVPGEGEHMLSNSDNKTPT